MKTESAAVEAVAWLCDAQDGVNVDATCRTNVRDDYARFGRHITPLVPQSALDALRGEVERLRRINTDLADKCNRLNLCGAQSDQRADAADRRVAELEAALQGVMYWDNGKSEWDEARAALTKESP